MISRRGAGAPGKPLSAAAGVFDRTEFMIMIVYRFFMNPKPFFRALGFFLFLTGIAKCAEAQGIILREFIFETAPFAQCHASTIAETRSGLVAAWFGGSREGASDVGIWESRQQDGKWMAPFEIARGMKHRGKNYPCWNPVLFELKNGSLLLFYKVGPTPAKWSGWLSISIDDGKTWSDGKSLPGGILGPIKDKPVQLSDGTLLCPSSAESDGGRRIHFELSKDLVTWTTSRPSESGTSIDAIQPSILLLGGNKLLALGRSWNKRIVETASNDSGETWGPISLTDIPNPNSGIDAVTLADGRQLLVYNHTDHGRSPLNVAISADGYHWQAALVLESGGGEYSYPAVIQTRDGMVHITYTWKRKRIRHVVLDPAKLVLKPIVDGKWP
jgi:predicted neuraminidase